MAAVDVLKGVVMSATGEALWALVAVAGQGPSPPRARVAIVVEHDSYATMLCATQAVEVTS